MTDQPNDDRTEPTTDDTEPTSVDDATTGVTDDGATPLSVADLPADRLRERAAPVDTTDPDAGLADLDALPGRLADATIVGLGEATHGTLEFFQLKHRFLRWLITDHGCRVVAMESNFAATRAIDEYVTHGEGDAAAALSGLCKWPWQVESIRALLEWLRAFNRDRPLADRVRFYGVDAQQTAGPTTALLEYLEAVDPEWVDDYRDGLDLLAEEGIDVEWAVEEFDPGAAAEQATKARATVDALIDRFEAQESAYVDATDRRAYELHVQYLRSLDAAVAYRAASRDDMAAAVRVRDETMADTLEWVLDCENTDQIALWAHDMHLCRGERTTDWGDLPGTGTHLADRFGEDYYAVGFDFARGEFQALHEADYELGVHSLSPPPGDAVTRLFDAVDEDLLFVDFETVTDDDQLADWFDAERSKRSLGSIYYGEDATDDHHETYRLPTAFDALVFVAETSRARPIEQG
jgi:erythromycin esterase